MLKRDCMRCDEPMDIGVLLEKDHGNASQTVVWHDGVPEFHGFLGGYGVKIKRSRQLDVYAFRCPKCFMLEAVAVDTKQLEHEGEQAGEISLSEGGSGGDLSES